MFLPHLTPERQRLALEEKESVYRAGLADIEPIPGAVELLDFADRLGLERAVVTNGPRANAEAVLAALGLAARLSIVVIGAELERSKPDPLPYRRGLELTRAAARRSVAFEELADRGPLGCGRRPRRGRPDHLGRRRGADRGGRDLRGRRLQRSAHPRTDRAASRRAPQCDGAALAGRHAVSESVLSLFNALRRIFVTGADFRAVWGSQEMESVIQAWDVTRLD